MSGRFGYVRYDQASLDLNEMFKAKVEQLDGYITALQIPETAYQARAAQGPFNADRERALKDFGRYQALARTHLEEAFMAIGKALRDLQVARGGDGSHQPARGEGK